MGTQLDTGAKPSGPPSIKLRSVGDHVNFAVVDVVNNIPVYKFGTKEVDMNAAGKPKVASRLTILVTGGNAVLNVDDVDRTVVVGELASIFIDSYTKYDPDNDKVAGDDGHVSFGKACDRIGGLEVGTCGQYAYLRDIASTKQGNNPRKDRKFKLRKAADSELAQSQRCEALKVELAAADAAPATALPTQTAANLGDF